MKPKTRSEELRDINSFDKLDDLSKAVYLKGKQKAIKEVIEKIDEFRDMIIEEVREDDFILISVGNFRYYIMKLKSQLIKEEDGDEV